MVDLEVLTTTVIGSYPIQISNEEMMLAFYKGEDPFLKSIELSVKDQLEAGINIISDGQTRSDMIKIFTGRIVGLESDMNTTTAVSKLGYPEKGITVQDQLYALNLIKGKDAKLKGILTGPSTILNTIKPGVYKTRSRELLFDIAEVLRREAEELERIGVFCLQIDEPIFSIKTEDLENSIAALDSIMHPLKLPVALHVCGSVKEIFPKLLDLKKLRIFHLELKSTPENLEVIKDYAPDMHLGIGVVNVYDDRIESVEEIKQLVEKVLDFFDAGKVLINPECGMRHLPRDVALNKLINIVKAKEQLKKERNL